MYQITNVIYNFCMLLPIISNTTIVRIDIRSIRCKVYYSGFTNQNKVKAYYVKSTNTYPTTNLNQHDVLFSMTYPKVSSNAPSRTAGLQRSFKIFHGTVIMYEAHKPKFMVINRNNLYVLFSCIDFAC